MKTRVSPNLAELKLESSTGDAGGCCANDCPYRGGIPIDAPLYLGFMQGKWTGASYHFDCINRMTGGKLTL